MKRAAWIVAFLVCFAGLLGCPDRRNNGASSSRGPEAAQVGLDGQGHMRPSGEDRCPVCAMPVLEPTRPLLSAISLDDGRTFYFCGTGCMIKTWLAPEQYLRATKEALDRPVVREYFDGDHVDARSVTFVTGSDVVGPMGPAIVPLDSAEDVETFQRRHGGTKSFSLNELDAASFRSILARRAGRDH